MPDAGCVTGGSRLRPRSYPTAARRERAILVHVFRPGDTRDKRARISAELRNLLETTGAELAGEIEQVVDDERPGTLIGTGKLRELAEMAVSASADLAVFGVDLNGSQLRNIEEAAAVRTVDRTQLILDIFARRARSYEGKAQVKLAQLQYLLPRLTGRGTAMSRLGGGIGARGPGETRLETDRRRIRDEIADLRRVIARRGERRRELRHRRERQGVCSVGIVGYTNAGKTTLLAELARRFGERKTVSGVDRLFDTLDVTSRRIQYRGRTCVFTDTVGFIRDLPHHLVDAFRSTLEEAVDADVIVHVIDVSSPDVLAEMETVYGVLERSLDVKAPVVALRNEKREIRRDMLPADRNAVETVYGSVRCVECLDTLLAAVDRLAGQREVLHLRVPHDRPDVVAEAYRVGEVDHIGADPSALHLDLRVDSRRAGWFQPFREDTLPHPAGGDERHL